MQDFLTDQENIFIVNRKRKNTAVFGVTSKSNEGLEIRNTILQLRGLENESCHINDIIYVIYFCDFVKQEYSLIDELQEAQLGCPKPG